MELRKMKPKRNLIISVFQLAVGLLAIAAFCILYTGGENMTKWIITLFLAVGYIIMGIMGIIKKTNTAVFKTEDGGVLVFRFR